MNCYIKEIQAAFIDLLGELSVKELTHNSNLSKNAQILQSLILSNLQPA